jgi:hypothetical protein
MRTHIPFPVLLNTGHLPFAVVRQRSGQNAWVIEPADMNKFDPTRSAVYVDAKLSIIRHFGKYQALVSEVSMEPEVAI